MISNNRIKYTIWYLSKLLRSVRVQGFSLNCLDKMKFEAHFIPLEVRWFQHTGMFMFCGCQIKNTCMILMKIKALILVCWLFYYTYTSYRLQYYIIPQHANFINGHNTSLTVASPLNSASLCSSGVSIVCNQNIFQWCILFPRKDSYFIR